MCTGRDWEERDRRAAHSFVSAARGIRRVVYLGGLQPPPGRPRVSAHLRSRGEVGRILREGLPTLEFRAGPVIGSGSGSFEMVRYLTERLPVMVGSALDPEPRPAHRGPSRSSSTWWRRWSTTPSGVVEIGGDALSFRDMLLQYAGARRLGRTVFTVPPVVPPSLAAPIVGLLTPIPNCLAVPLVEGDRAAHPAPTAARAGAAFPKWRP